MKILNKFFSIFYKNPRWFLFLICFLLVLFFDQKTIPLKKIGYQYIPDATEILDEHDFAWLGKSVLTTGVPTAWSDLGAYPAEIKEKFNLKINNFSIQADEKKPAFKNYRSFPKPLVKIETLDYGKGPMQTRFVQPYLDHPPLAGMIYALGVKQESQTFADVDASQFRLPNFWLYRISAILLFFLASQIYGPLVGLMAFLFYTTIPSFVFTFRLALAENVMIPFLLSSLNLLFLGKHRQQKIFFVLAGFFAGLGALTKLSGWSLLLIGFCLMLFYKRSKKEIISFLIPGVLTASLYFLYAWYLAGGFFWQIILSQSSRFFWGSFSFFQQIARVTIKDFPLDGWYLGGFFILAYLSFFKKNRELGIITGVYLFSVLFLGGGNYSWYYFPLFPFLALGIAVLIKKLMVKFSFIDLGLFFLFPFSSSFYWGFGVLHSEWNLQWLYRGLIIFFLILGFLWQSKLKRNPFFKLLFFIFLVFLVHRLYLWNYRSVLYLMANWGKLLPPLIFR